MIGITLTTDQIRSAPPEVRRWIEHQVIAALGITAEASGAPSQTAHLAALNSEEAEAVLSQIEDVMPAVNVFFEFGRPGISFGQPPVMTFRLIDILHHTRLQNVGQIMTCLDLINQALAKVHGDPTARFCGFDNEGHCLITPQTQASIASLWQNVLTRQQPAANAVAT